MGALVIVLIDHRRSQEQLHNIEFEANKWWVDSDGTQENSSKWAHAGAPNKYIGGVSVGIHPAVARYAHSVEECEDERGWGRWTGIMITGHAGSIAIIVAYAPSETRKKMDNGEPIEQKHTMWNIQKAKMENIPVAERQTDPTHQFNYDLMNQVAKLKALNYEVIVAGDYNINWKGTSPKVKLWKASIANQDLVNVMHKWHHNEQHKIYTYKQNETKTWIDYHLVSSSIIIRGAVLRAGIEQGGLSYSSDHMLTAIEINFTRLLGRIQGQPTLYTPRTRSLMSTIPEHCEMYQEQMKELLRTDFNNLRADAAKLIALARQQGRKGTSQENKKLVHMMDDVMEKLTHLMLQAEDKMEIQKRKYKGKNKRDVWSGF